jgi:SAM-dependent methyltransferase
MPKLILERPVSGSTPAGQLALHEAGYREVLARLGSGRILDVGCGDGDESGQLARSDRTVVGLDYEPGVAAGARRRHGDLRIACGDGASMPFRDGAFDAVVSSHLIEHFVAPEGHVREMARVVNDGGSVFVITPNGPADFENPFHVHLFEAPELRAMLERHFEDVSVLALDGDEVVKADFDRRRALGRRLLKIDVFGLRHRLPRRWFIRLHGAGRALVYPFVNRRDRDQPPVTADRFSLGGPIDDSTLVLFAVASTPRRSAGSASASLSP